jgi:N-acetylglucosaminyldiphosphoundecaprenol N-acetyl-beta-D-mannosaminyltransferase
LKKLKTSIDCDSPHSLRVSPLHPLKTTHILPIRVDNTNYDDATNRILTWAVYGEKRYVCVANVHMAMEAHKDDRFRKIVNKSDLVTPDGMPLVWTMRLLGAKNQTRVYGPTLTLRICEVASKFGFSVGFYGGSLETIKYLVQNISNRFSILRIAYAHSPPFRPLRPEEDEAMVQDINNSGAKILFVGLGCPKQEHWMFNHLGRINAVMIGVGAAFDFHAGLKKQAPRWMMVFGLEWLFRLCQEPKRLWRRYLCNNPRYLYLVARQILKERLLRT